MATEMSCTSLFLNKKVALYLPGVEHFAAQGRMAWVSLSRPILAATGALASDQKDFVVGDVAAFAVG